MADYKAYNMEYDEVMDVQDCEFGTGDFPSLTSADYYTIGMTILGEDQSKSALKEATSKAVTPAKTKMPASDTAPEEKIKFQNRANRERYHILIKLNAKPVNFQNAAYYELNDPSGSQNVKPKYGPTTQIQYYNNHKPKIKYNRM